MSSKKEEGTFEKTRKNVGSYALNFLNQIRSFQIKMDQIRISCMFNKSKMCLTWNRWNIIIFLFLLLQGGGHFWKKTCQNGWCARLFEATHWQLLASFRYVHGVAEMHYSATTKAKRVFSFSTCHIGPNEWINNIVVPSFTIRCTQAVLHIDSEIIILLKNFCGLINPEGGGGQNDLLLVRRMSVISHMVMLWSQKILTLFINISSRR